MRSDNKIIQGLIESADDSNEWWEAWKQVGAYFRKHWARERAMRQQLANALATVLEIKRGQELVRWHGDRRRGFHRG